MRPFLLALFVLGCADGRAPGPQDRRGPELEVRTPARGTVPAESSIEVEGIVADDSGARVRLEVDGELVNPSSDGSFRHRLDLEPGFHLLETVATDAAGNRSEDVRALVVGELMDGADGVNDALRARVGQDQLEVVDAAVAEQLAGLDLGGMIAAGNPVFKTGGGCLRASVDVEDIDVGAVTVRSQAQTGALHVEVALETVHADLLADYRVACIGGKQSIDVDAERITVSGELVFAIEDGRVVAVLDNAEVSSDGLDADIGFAPLEPLINAIDQVIFDRLANTLEEQLAEQVAGLIDQGINRAYTLSFDGIDFRYRIAPTGIAVESSGLGFTTSLRAWVDGQSAVPFVGSPKRLPTLAQDGVSLVITDDAVSHALSVLWSAGVFERSFSVAQLGVFPGLSRLSLELPMSPVVEADDSGITVAIADARIGLFAESGGSEELVVELAASALVDIELAADDDGSIEVALGIGTLTIQITEQRPLAAEILDLDSLAALAGAAIEVVLADLNRNLADLELPVIFGVELLVREASSGAGGALFTGELDSP